MATKPSAILRIKDSSGSWREIPAIKGDSGVGIEKVENVDGKLKITLTDGRTTEFEIGTGSGGTGTGADGKDGLDGSKITNITSNEDGSITITVETPLEDGSVETKEYPTISLKGDQGISITKTEINDNGELVITYSDNKTETLGRVVGKDGDTPYIGENGNWYIDDTDTEVKAEGNSGVYVGTGEMPDNCNVQIDPSGEETITLPNPYALTFTGAATGSYDGSTPLTINIPDGADGKTPYIKDGNWWIGETDTGVKAVGDDGYTPVKGVDYWTSTDKAEIVEAATAALDLSSYATHEDVEQEIANFNFIQVLTALPESYGFPNRIYLVPKTDTQTEDLFDEYLWVNKGTEEEPQWEWEWITTKQIEVDLTPYATKEYVDTSAALNTLKSVYPVGSIYLTMNETNPDDLFGFGTWEKLPDRFLLGASDTYEVGSTGGEATHTLSSKEMPAHTHRISSSLQWANQTGNVQGGTNTYYKRSESQTTELTGEGQPHNNMPPYLAVYMWQRTA